MNDAASWLQKATGKLNITYSLSNPSETQFYIKTIYMIYNWMDNVKEDLAEQEMNTREAVDNSRNRRIWSSPAEASSSATAWRKRNLGSQHYKLGLSLKTGRWNANAPKRWQESLKNVSPKVLYSSLLYR